MITKNKERTFIFDNIEFNVKLTNTMNFGLIEEYRIDILKPDELSMLHFIETFNSVCLKEICGWSSYNGGLSYIDDSIERLFQCKYGIDLVCAFDQNGISHITDKGSILELPVYFATMRITKLRKNVLIIGSVPQTQ